MQTMNKTLALQLQQITGIDQQDVLSRKIQWASLSTRRSEFLSNLEKALLRDGFVVGTKNRSKAYSDSVVAYDKKVNS